MNWEHECDFTSHHLREICESCFLRYFTWNCKNHKNQARTEVKCDSVNCWKWLLSVNFPWMWIYWLITSLVALNFDCDICKNSPESNFKAFENLLFVTLFTNQQKCLHLNQLFVYNHLFLGTYQLLRPNLWHF